MQPKIWIFLLSILLFQSCTITQKSFEKMNIKAWKEIEKNLEIIYNDVNGTPKYGCKELSRSIFFLQETTNIESKYIPGELGLCQTCQEDYNAWNQWYLENKEILYWNRKTQTIELRDSANNIVPFE